jgi:hypothetical protein
VLGSACAEGDLAAHGQERDVEPGGRLEESFDRPHAVKPAVEMGTVESGTALHRVVEPVARVKTVIPIVTADAVVTGALSSTPETI